MIPKLKFYHLAQNAIVDENSKGLTLVNIFNNIKIGNADPRPLQLSIPFSFVAVIELTISRALEDDKEYRYDLELSSNEEVIEKIAQQVTFKFEAGKRFSRLIISVNTILKNNGDVALRLGSAGRMLINDAIALKVGDDENE